MPRDLAEACAALVTEVWDPVVAGQVSPATGLITGSEVVASELDDAAAVDALGAMWRALVSTRLTLTGAVTTNRLGARLSGRDEARVAVAFAVWTARQFEMQGRADALDVLERTLYNAIAAGACGWGAAGSGPSEASDGGTLSAVAWCLSQVPGLSYATTARELYTGLYMAGTARIAVADGCVALTQISEYPWEGAIQIRVEPEHRARFALNLRIPGWARGQLVPGGRYEYLDRRIPRPLVRLNGTYVPTAPVTGFVRLERVWEPGDEVGLAFPMPVRRLQVPRSGSSAARMGLQRGPLVYGSTDSSGAGCRLDLDPDDIDALRAEWRRDHRGGAVVIEGSVARKGHMIPFTAVPYCVCGSRGEGDRGV